MFGVPRLEPGPDAAFKIVHDLVGNAGVNVGPHRRTHDLPSSSRRVKSDGSR
jgi:hypothetical protein